MGIQERKERERNHRRKTILKSAKKIILKSGVDGMSMNQLAEATELNKATLYLYFTNRDDLIDAVVFEGLTVLEKQFQEVDALSLSGLDQVMKFVECTFTFYRQYPVYFYAMNHQERRKVKERMESPYSAKGDELASRIFGKVAEGLQKGMEDGSIRREINISAFLILLFAKIYGVTHMMYAKEDVTKDLFHMEAETIETSALEMIHYYLKK